MKSRKKTSVAPSSQFWSPWNPLTNIKWVIALSLMYPLCLNHVVFNRDWWSHQDAGIFSISVQRLCVLTGHRTAFNQLKLVTKGKVSFKCIGIITKSTNLPVWCSPSVKGQLSPSAQPTFIHDAQEGGKLLNGTFASRNSNYLLHGRVPNFGMKWTDVSMSLKGT